MEFHRNPTSFPTGKYGRMSGIPLEYRRDSTGNQIILFRGNLSSAGIPPRNLSIFPEEFEWHFSKIQVDFLIEFQRNSTGFPAVISSAGIPLLFQWNSSALHWKIFPYFSSGIRGYSSRTWGIVYGKFCFCM